MDHNVPPPAIRKDSIYGTFIFEFGAPGGDWDQDSLISALVTCLPGLRVRRVHGIFNTYRPGGLQVRRLVNLFAVYVRTLFQVIGGKQDVIIVRSSPPGIQLWVAWLAHWRKIPVIYWLMDSHPEMEARICDHRGWRRVARVLRRVDAWAMRTMAAVIVLDDSMAERAHALAPEVPVVVHPPWNRDVGVPYDPISYVPGSDAGVRRFGYAGNLGVAHDPQGLMRVALAARAYGRVEMHFISATESTKAHFQPLLEAGVEVQFHPRVKSFLDLKEVFERLRLDLGVVLLDQDSAGLVSPSKFTAYLKFGLPVLYIGPEKTNTELICARFGAGWRLPNGASDVQIQSVVGKIWDAQSLTEARSKLPDAAGYFWRLNEHSLAAALVPHVPQARSHLRCRI